MIFWGKEEQQAFLEAKEMLKKEALLVFPDLTKPFHLYTQMLVWHHWDSTQGIEPSTQKNYTGGEQELLEIVEALKAFKGIVYKQDVIVHTDHLNLLYSSNMSSARMSNRGN